MASQTPNEMSLPSLHFERIGLRQGKTNAAVSGFRAENLSGDRGARQRSYPSVACYSACKGAIAGWFGGSEIDSISSIPRAT